MDYFLECANHAESTSSGSSTDLETVRENTQDVLTNVADALLELFAKDRTQTTMESTYLNDVMRKLGDLDDTRVGECITDDLVPKILNLAEKLATANAYANTILVEGIQESARALKANIARVKCMPGMT